MQLLQTAPIIDVANVSKLYRVYSSPGERVKRLLGLRSRYIDFKALEEVTFQVAKGSAVGIIGENGAGKSTLLKIITGTTAATNGIVRLDGVVASILELGAAFHPEFTGAQNAVLYGALLGIDGREMEKKLPEIYAFAELGKFIDYPLKTYSTGMTMRLGFAVATHMDADVLVIDEALAVGDGYFQKKCIDRLLEAKRDGVTILFCSHALYYVTTFCDRALWLREGRVERFGEVKDVVEAYEAYLLTREKRTVSSERASGEPGEDAAQAVGRITGLRASSSGASGEISPGGPLDIEMDIASAHADATYHVGVAIDTLDGRCVVGVSTHWDDLPPLAGATAYRVRLRIPELCLASGTFSLSGFLLDETGLHVHDQVAVTRALTVASPSWTPALMEVDHEWEMG